MNPPSTLPLLSEHERAVLREHGRTFELLIDTSYHRRVIHCLVCGRISYHPDDLTHRWCAACNRFHEERAREYAAWPKNRDHETALAPTAALEERLH